MATAPARVVPADGCRGSRLDELNRVEAVDRIGVQAQPKPVGRGDVDRVANAAGRDLGVFDPLGVQMRNPPI